ncbi:MAG: tryptophan-rich sensory protein [Rhizobiaceae bacterium]|nr:tryptophan-rich sensory protein [Rhizobiaceae bacterium]
MKSAPLLALVLFVVGVVVVGSAIGYLTAPGEWYQSLQKPPFNPPSWVFGPVWTILYILIGVAGWRVWTVAPRGLAMVLWVVQMALNWLWSPVFFAAQMPWAALVVVAAMLAAIVWFIVEARKVDRIASGLFVPYAAWVAFATVLNGSIAALN